MNKLWILLRRLTEVRIEVKIMGIVIGISMFALLVGGVGLMHMSKINRMSAQIYQQELLGISYIKEAYVNLICLARAEKNVMLSLTKEDKSRYYKIHKENEALYLANIRNVEPLLQTEQAKAVLARLERAWAQYSDVSKRILDLAEAFAVQTA